MPASSSLADTWHKRGRTLQAMVMLLVAMGLVALAPFQLWRKALTPKGTAREHPVNPREARLWAAHVERAAARLVPLDAKCLPRAMALSWLLTRSGIVHQFVIAVRPQEGRSAQDALHAWIEAGGERVIGDLPGPWIETLRLGK